jgi:hypothetical protein
MPGRRAGMIWVLYAGYKRQSPLKEVQGALQNGPCPCRGTNQQEQGKKKTFLKEQILNVVEF